MHQKMKSKKLTTPNIFLLNDLLLSTLDFLHISCLQLQQGCLAILVLIQWWSVITLQTLINPNGACCKPLSVKRVSGTV